MKNIKLAKELIKLAQELIAVPTDTYQNFQEYSKDYYDKYEEYPDEKLWDLFETQEEVDAFLQNKSKNFPNLKQIISEETINRLLENDWFVIISAGRNEEQINDNSVTDQQIKQRYNQLRKFLESLNLPYYEVIGQYFKSSQLSYIVDLSNNGKNDESKIKSNLRKIRSFGNQIKQDAIIEGLGKQRVYMCTTDQNKNYYQKKKELNPVNDIGRSQVFTDEKDRKKNKTWADDYDFEKKEKGDWLK